MTAGSLHRPGVSLDVLVRVMNILVEEDSFPAEEAISAMSQTCRYLRTEFIRRLLTGTVRVNTFDQPEIIAPFCQFVLNDPIFRIPLLRRFKINVHHLMEDAARAFADLLSLASHLEHLEIDSLLEVTKTVAAIICSALSSLTSLKHLTVEHCKSDDPSYHSMFYHTFQTMQSHLTSVEVILPAIKTPSPRILYMRYQDPIFILSRLAGSLRSVRLEGTTRLGGGIRVFPLVEELQITNHIKGMPDLRTYILSFPNLRRLRCGITNSYWIRYRHTTNTLNVPCGLASVKEWHDYNKQDSTRHNRGWGSLQTFRGSIIDAYVLSCLPCHGIRLHLLSTGGTRSSEEIMLSTILSETRPSSLRLCLKVYKARGYIPILPPHSFWAESLTELEIRINIVQHSFDLDECFIHITELLRPTSVTSFRLEFRCANWPFGQSLELQEDRSEVQDGVKCENHLEWKDAMCYTHRAILQDDFQKRVRDIVSACPTLRKTTLMWARCYAEVPTWVVGVDVDNIPHSTDRPGNELDEWEKVDVDW